MSQHNNYNQKEGEKVLESSTVAMLVNNFNIVVVSVSIFFAICGILVIIGQKIGKNIFSGKTLFRVFCMASVIAFAAELTFFNFQYYLRYFAGPELHTVEASSENPNIILLSDGTHAEMFAKEEDGYKILEITFKNIDRKVTSIFADLAFNDNETTKIAVIWTDEESTRSYSRELYKHLPHENYVLLQSCGKVSELTVMFKATGSSSSPVGLISIAINKPVPFYFSGLRLLAVSFLILAIIIFLHKKLRAKASYYLFEYKFNPANKKQNLVYAFTVALLILFTWMCVYTTPTKPSFDKMMSLQYNKYLVDALMEGRTWLDFGNPQKLLDAERPHDFNWLKSNGYEFGVDWMVDWVWYKGKFYSYFGIVPAIILFVPYKMITGNYLSHYAAVSLFISIAVCLLALLWRFCVKKYMPDTRFVFYLLSFLALFFAIGLFGILRFLTVHTTIQSAGFMFSVAGVLLLLKSVENDNVNRLK